MYLYMTIRGERLWFHSWDSTTKVAKWTYGYYRAKKTSKEEADLVIYTYNGIRVAADRGE